MYDGKNIKWASASWYLSSGYADLKWGTNGQRVMFGSIQSIKVSSHNPATIIINASSSIHGN